MNLTKEKHATPGPWHAHGTKVSTWETQDEIDFHGDEVIAETGFNANARLIAAAPDMYETMKAILAVINDPRPIFPGTAIGAKLREILAKVDGGEG